MASPAYRTVTTQVSAKEINTNFVRKVEDNVKEASAQVTSYVRDYVRQHSFARKIFTPQNVDASMLDPSVDNDTPRIIVEEETESYATFVPFASTSDRKYIRMPRTSCPFGKITSDKWRKNKWELMTYKSDIVKILQDNSVFDMADTEDTYFYDTILDIVTTFPAQSIAAGTAALSKAGLVAGLKALLSKKLNIGKILLTKELFVDLLLFDAVDVGDGVAERLYDEGVESQTKLWGYDAITTIKSDILPANEMWIFAPEEYLGKYFLLEDATVHIKQEADMIEFYAYSVLGVTFVNVGGVIRVTFP